MHFLQRFTFPGKETDKKKPQKNPKTNNHTLQMKDLKAIKLCIWTNIRWAWAGATSRSGIPSLPGGRCSFLLQDALSLYAAV